MVKKANQVGVRQRLTVQVSKGRRYQFESKEEHAAFEKTKRDVAEGRAPSSVKGAERGDVKSEE